MYYQKFLIPFLIKGYEETIKAIMAEVIITFIALYFAFTLVFLIKNIFYTMNLSILNKKFFIFLKTQRIPSRIPYSILLIKSMIIYKCTFQRLIKNR